MSDIDAIVEEYIELTGRMSDLKERRDALKCKLIIGRNKGVHFDVRVTEAVIKRIDMSQLRLHVTPHTIDLCMVSKMNKTFSVVTKLLPKKPKAKK